MKSIKRILGIFFLLETLTGLGMLLFNEEIRQVPIAAIIVITIFALLTYACFKKPKHKGEKIDKSGFSLKHTTETSEITTQTSTTPCFAPDNTIFHTDDKLIPNKEVPIDTKSDSAAEKLETAQKMLNESLNQLNKAVSSGNILKATVQQSDAPSAKPNSGISYIEDDKMIVRTDGKEISDDEIPYLIQVGREEAIAKLKIPELTRLISESYQIMQTTENPETLCNRYNFIVKKVNELASIEQKGLFDRNTLNQYNALISDNNFYNLIILCYQKYVTKAKSELKTQNGINNRVNKFWNVIYQNVSAEFYNEKFKKGKT